MSATAGSASIFSKEFVIGFCFWLAGFPVPAKISLRLEVDGRGVDDRAAAVAGLEVLRRDVVAS